MSVFSEGFFKTTLGADGLTPGKNGVPINTHTIFLHSKLLPATEKLQRETRGRKTKDLHTELQSAVLGLRSFMMEDWPPKSDDAATVDTANVTESSVGTAESPVSVESKADEGSDGKEDSKPSAEENKDSSGKSGEETEQPENEMKTTNSTTASASRSSSPDNAEYIIRDDPQTRERMHPSVVSALQVIRKIMVHPGKTPRAIEIGLDIINLFVTYRYVSGRAGGRDDHSGSGSGAVGDESKKEPSLLHVLLETVTSCSEQNVDAIQLALIKCLTAVMTSPKCGVHEGSMLLCLKSTFHVYLVTKSQTAKDMSKAALLDMMRSVFSRMEAYDVISKSMLAENAPPQPQPQVEENTSEGDDENYKPPPFPSQYHTDSYVLFRALCKMSSKELPVDNAEAEPTPRLFATASGGTDPMALNNKLLSLDLILSSMDYLGEAFREARFLHLVQHYLCVSLLQNCMSHQTEVAFLSQKIFLVLVYKFKGQLKQEIEVFLSNIFLRVLDSANSSFKQKAIVLESLSSLCRDPVLLTQIFLNYDCDFDAMNLYKDIVQALTKLGGKASVNPSSNKKEAEEDQQLSLAGLETLLTILKAFLGALNLPGSDDRDNESASNAIRSMLQLSASLTTRSRPNPHPNISGVISMESSVVSGTDDNLTDREANEGTVAGKMVDAFEQKRNAEQNFETGAVKFTLSAKSGLRFFFECGLTECKARSVAAFFLANKDKLDKTQMGEVLGREPDAAFTKEKGLEAEDGGPGFFVRILHNYVDLLDFTGLAFDEAIRLFLSGFRLPGEAQKIDRIMEKFAEKFTSQNPEVFPSSDTAFILAFSVIMLNTDLHNPSIKPDRRMTVDSFLRNNRGIGSGGSDLDEEFLTGIFNRIKEMPFSLKEDDDAREKINSGARPIFDSSIFEGSALFGANPEEKRRELFKMEKEEMMTATQKLVRQRPAAGKSTSSTDSIPPSDVVKPMFDVTWGPLMGVFSLVLECADHEPSVSACLNGIVYSIRIASHSNMSLVRDTFVSTLTKFTFLGSPKEMKPKNVESIRTLLGLAIHDGEALGSSWGTVLQYISQLARLRLSASGLDSDESFLVEKEEAGTPSKPTAMQLTKEEQARAIQATNGRLVMESVQEVLIDKVFSSSVNLTAKSLGMFISELISISQSEIAGTSKEGLNSARSEEPTEGKSENKAHSEGPAIFSLQRLVEVADSNMNVRPRLVWAQVWEVMADYFAQIACNENVRVSAYAVDSLRQLSFKFLEKPELSEFNFQRLFLKPFLVVMEDNTSTEEVRELVLRCVDNMIRTKASSLRSGWKVIFSILTKSASDPCERIEYLGIAVLQRLLDEHLDELFSVSGMEDGDKVSSSMSAIERRVRNSVVDDFNDLCRASLAFVQVEESDSPRSAGLSMRAFCHTAIYADLLAAGRILPPVEGAPIQSHDPSMAGYSYPGLSDDEALSMILWRPLIDGLAEGIRSTVKSMAGGVGCIIQRGSALALRAILLRHGHLFTTNQLRAIVEESLIPAIQAGVESDQGPTVTITSESPSLSSIDFLVNPLPVPPPPDDISLLRFEAMNASPDRRSLGKAELMLEASFSDLRHNGDGDLRRAFILAKKAAAVAPKPIEQPFPNSWVATTSPVALGLLTDIASELLPGLGSEGRTKILPLLTGQLSRWCIGTENEGGEWQPCEAVARVACREIHRLSDRLSSKVQGMETEDASAWSLVLVSLINDVISTSVELQAEAWTSLVESKEEAIEARKGKGPVVGSIDDEPGEAIQTPFGGGRVIKIRHDKYEGKAIGQDADFLLDTKVVRLKFGAELYAPVIDTARHVIPLDDSSYGKEGAIPQIGIPHEVSVPNAYWEELVPFLKIRIVTIHCLQKSMVAMLGNFVKWLPQGLTKSVLDTLSKSRSAAHDAGRDEDLKTAFQEALLHEWGDGVAEVEMALDSAARLSHLHGSSMFFLTQESSATHALLNTLSMLYLKREGSSLTDQDASEKYAEPLILELLEDVTSKFLASEKNDGHLVDPNIWRNVNESGGKVALYCTSFAPVIVEILQLIHDTTSEQFSRHRKVFFSLVSSLVRVHSEEIRQLVQMILDKHVAPLL